MTSDQERAARRRFETPADGLRELEAAHAYWSERVTEFSFQSSIGLIAANWALHSQADKLLEDRWAVASVCLAICALLVSLFGAWLVAGETRKQYYLAVNDRASWNARWDASERIVSEWPFTPYITKLGAVFRFLRMSLPILGGVAFLVGAIT